MKATPEQLREEFHYVTDSGKLIRRKTGEEVGQRQKSGYTRVSVFGSMLLAHRVVFAVVEGRWPRGQLDHVNRNKSDNRRANLREVTPSENGRNRGANKNNTSGFKGVTFCRRTGRWVAQIVRDRKNIFLGRFPTREEAASARKAGEREWFGSLA